MNTQTALFLFSTLLLAPRFAAAQSAPADTTAVNRTIDSLLQASTKLTKERQYDQALTVNAEAERLALTHLGRVSAGYGKICSLNGRIAYHKQEWAEAEKWWLEEMTIRENLLGKEYPKDAKALNNLGLLYTNMGRYEQAEAYYLESKAIKEKTLGSEHPEFVGTLNNLGNLYRAIGRYEQAEAYHLQCKTIRQKTLGELHPAYAASLNNLGILYHDMGQYERAETYYLQCKSIRQTALGEQHPEYAATLNNLGVVYQNMGLYEQAETYYLEGMAIQIAELGEDHPEYAKFLNNLGSLYAAMGRYEQAATQYLKSKDIQDNVSGQELPDYMMTLGNLGNLYFSTGKYQQSLDYYLQSKTLEEKSFGKEHPEYAATLNNVGNLYVEMGRYDAAAQSYLEAKAIREKTLGTDHPDYAGSLNSLGIAYYRMGRFAEAERYYREAKTIREKTPGKEHPDYASSLKELAALFERQVRLDSSDACFNELYPLKQSLLSKGVTHLSQRELAAYAATFQSDGDELASYTANRRAKGQPVSILPTLHYDHQLFQKGFLLGATTRLNTLAAATPESEDAFLRLKGYRRRLAAEYAKPSAERQNVPELETRADSLEKILTRTLAGFGEALRQVQWQEVQAQLQPGEAAVEFVHFRYYDPQASATDSTLYAALVLLPSETAPRFVPLCEARQIGAVLKKAGSDQLRFQNIYNALDGSSPLYPLLWQPMEAHLQGAHTVYYAPAGIVHRLNLGAIQPTKRETLSDRYRLAALGSTRQLVIPATASPAGNTAAVFGGIRYEMDSTQIAAVNSAFADTTAALATRGASAFAYTDSTLRGGDWKFLPATEAEAKNISTLLRKHGFQTDTRLGFEATEESVQRLGSGKSPSPRVLHIATHGFFFPDPNSKSDGPSFTIADDPMIRSGLILAGAEHGWKTGKPLRPDMEDGVLTAYEISRMNLRNTELVVLSACKTGLGDIQGNEGVYGLQRAFKIAGARYLLMSLWEAPDKPTQEFMEAFYAEWLDKSRPIPDAYRAAQAQMQGRYENPYFWAGFVLVE